MDEPILTYEGTTRTWLTADPQGSIIALADDAGTATAVNGYGPYGEPPLSATGSAITGRFGYTGQAAIEGIGNLYDYRARTYAPWLGRFLQADPIGTDGGMNLYEYADSDPVNGSDPSGLAPIYGPTLDPTYGGNYNSPFYSNLGTITVTANRSSAGGGGGGAGAAFPTLGGLTGGLPASMRAPSLASAARSAGRTLATRGAAAGAAAAVDGPLPIGDAVGVGIMIAGVADAAWEMSAPLADKLDELAESTVVHANNLLSQRPTTVYELVGPRGTLKYGMTCADPATCRYSSTFYARNRARMIVRGSYPWRWPARIHEVALCTGYLARNGHLPPLSVRC